MARSKLLEMHPEKTFFMASGSKEQIKEIADEIFIKPLMFGNFEMKKKPMEKWLGELISDEGVDKSIVATVKRRSRTITAAIF